MFGKWFEEYRKLSSQSRFISQLAMFFISIFTILGFYDIARVLHFNPTVKLITIAIASIKSK